MKQVIVTVIAASLLMSRGLSQDLGFAAAARGPGGPALNGLISNRGVNGVNAGLFNSLPASAESLFSATDVAAGDFNGDGIGDIAVAQGLDSGGTLTILSGEGDGTFGLPVSVPVMNKPTSLAIADLNNDSFADIAVAGMDYTSEKSGQLQIFNGLELTSGTPSTMPTLWLDGPPTELSIGRLDGDAFPDVAVGLAYGDGSGGLQVLSDFGAPLPNFGDTGPAGTMSFSNGGTRFFETVPRDVDVFGGGVAIGTTNGLTTFRPGATGFNPEPFGTGPTFGGGVQVAVGDFNADGIDDLFTLNGMTPPAGAPTGGIGGDSGMNVFMGTPDGGFNDPASPLGAGLPPGFTGTDMTVGDFNMDGFPDIGVAISNGGFGAPPGNIQVIQNNGSGGFSIGPTYPMSAWPNFEVEGLKLSFNAAGAAGLTLDVMGFCREDPEACGGNGLAIGRNQNGVSAGTSPPSNAALLRGHEGHEARRFDVLRRLGRHLGGLLTFGQQSHLASARFPTFGGGQMRGQVEPARVVITATGASTGDFFKMEIIDTSGRVHRGALPEGVVLEPVAAPPVTPSPSDNVTTQAVSGFCLDFAKDVPAPGTRYRIASPAAQAAGAPIRNVLAATKQLALRNLLHSDGSPGYVNFIRQYAVWAKRENWDLKKFGESFVERTKQNVVSMKADWTGVMEQGVRAAIPGRWRDIEEVVRLSNEIAKPPKPSR